MESLERRGEYRNATKFYKVINQMFDRPTPTEEELKEIDRREKYFYEMLEFYWSLEKPYVDSDLELEIITKMQYYAKLEAYEKLPEKIKEVFALCRKGIVIFDAENYIRSYARGFCSTKLLYDFKNMLGWVMDEDRINKKTRKFN